MKVKFLSVLILALVTINAVAEDLMFKSDSEISLALGMLGGGDPLLKKQLGTGVGKTIKIQQFTVSTISSSEWEKGGSLELQTDDSMGIAYSIACELPPNLGDKFMKDKKRRTVSITGKIKHYSSKFGLVIDPCNATW